MDRDMRFNQADNEEAQNETIRFCRQSLVNMSPGGDNQLISINWWRSASDYLALNLTNLALCILQV